MKLLNSRIEKLTIPILYNVIYKQSIWTLPMITTLRLETVFKTAFTENFMLFPAFEN